MRSLPALALALLLVTAGCNGVFETDDQYPTVPERLKGTLTATEPEPQPSNTTLPPGVNPGSADEVDERTLYLAHEGTLENRSVTWRTLQVYTNATGSVLGWSTATTWNDGPEQRYEIEQGGENPGSVRISEWEIDFWTNGSVTVTRQTLPNGSTERRARSGGPPGTFDVGAGRYVLENVLTGAELRYVGAERRNGTALHVLAETTDRSRLTVRVTADGVVRSLVYRTTATIDGQNFSVTRHFRTYDIGSTTVEKPTWAENVTVHETG